MTAEGGEPIVLQSIIFGDREIQVSYNDAESRDAFGVEVRTAVIAVTGALTPEVAELHDAVMQLLGAWHGLRREASRSG